MNTPEAGRAIPTRPEPADRPDAPLQAPARSRTRPRRAASAVSIFVLPLVALTLAFTFPFTLRAAETIPPAPQNHFNDYARLVRPETARQLNAELAQFERDTSSQLLVAIFPRMQSDSSLEDYTVRIFEAWHPGTKRQSNGAILFVFAAERRLRIATGYGLEGALPDALCKQIIEDEIAPHLRRGDFDTGLTAGVRAMTAAVRGEYRGTGRTQRDAQTGSSGGMNFVVLALAFIVITYFSRRLHRHEVYGRRGRRTVWVGHPWGGGGSSWGGGGTFSGGGGSTGGGGASGSW